LTKQQRVDFENYADQCMGGAAQASEAVKTLCEEGLLAIGEARVILKALGAPSWVPETDRAQGRKQSTINRVCKWSA
jgi:hypothetical protein